MFIPASKVFEHQLKMAAIVVRERSPVAIGTLYAAAIVARIMS